MYSILLKISPVILTFAAGIILKKFKVFSSEDGDTLLKLIFTFGIPALILKSIPGIEINKGLIILPFLAIIILIICGLGAFAAGKILKAEKTEAATAIVGSLIMNLGFVLPFIGAFFGDSGIAMALVFDMGNAFFAFTVAYFIALKLGTKKINDQAFKNLFKNPPLAALFLAVILNIMNLDLPVFLQNFFQFSGDMTLPLIMVALGLKFSLSKRFSLFIVTSISARMFTGFLTAYTLLLFTDFNSVTKQIILLCSAAPIGFNTMTFSVLTGLDDEFAASIVSYSILAGLVVLPVIFIITKAV